MQHFDDLIVISSVCNGNSGLCRFIQYFAFFENLHSSELKKKEFQKERQAVR